MISIISYWYITILKSSLHVWDPTMANVHYLWLNVDYIQDKRLHICHKNFETNPQSIIFGLPLFNSWWRHQMETFSALLAICAGNSPVHGEFPTQRPVTRSFDVYFDLRPNKWLSKQSWGWWFETLSCSLWRHRNVVPVGFLPHDPYCHISTQSQQLAGHTLAKGFVHSIKIYNKYYMFSM